MTENTCAITQKIALLNYNLIISYKILIFT